MSLVVVDMMAVGTGVDAVTGTGVGMGVDPEPSELITCEYPSLAHNDPC